MIARFQQSRGDLLPRNACMRLDPAHDSYCLSERERRSMTCRRPVHVFSSQSRRPVLQQRRHQHWGTGARAFSYQQLVAELPSMETLQSRVWARDPWSKTRSLKISCFPLELAACFATFLVFDEHSKHIFFDTCIFTSIKIDRERISPGGYDRPHMFFFVPRVI